MAFSRSLVYALSELDIIATDAPDADPPGPGIVIFDALTDEVCDAVGRLGRTASDRVLAVAAKGSVLSSEAQWELIEAGAADVLAWDDSPDPISTIVARIERWVQVEQLLYSKDVRDSLAGGSRVWLSVLRQVVEISRFTDASVLITGQSGTGKELVARLIHELDPRDDKGEMEILDCTTISPELAGSEFFGHERGAFTTAVTSRDGAFALANGGTLFIDEVGELPLSLQAELLRVVQERTYKRVGGNDWRQVNFRLICATNRDLEHERAQGNFRDDFYHRLDVICTWAAHNSWSSGLRPSSSRPKIRPAAGAKRPPIAAPAGPPNAPPIALPDMGNARRASPFSAPPRRRPTPDLKKRLTPRPTRRSLRPTRLNTLPRNWSSSSSLVTFNNSEANSISSSSLIRPESSSHSSSSSSSYSLPHSESPNSSLSYASNSSSNSAPSSS
ncbi:MAG: sigma-54 factor interaction domain-containing protein [Planctomycetales bacterium]|nr:sigma-54 factor interaction domain-containing protein [Planctomycetales bacterium]